MNLKQADLAAMVLNKLPLNGTQLYLMESQAAEQIVLAILEKSLGGKEAFEVSKLEHPHGITDVTFKKIKATGMEPARHVGVHPALGMPYGSGSDRDEDADQVREQTREQQPVPGLYAGQQLRGGASKAHGEQADTPENWDGERRARYWQNRALMAESFLHEIESDRFSKANDLVQFARRGLQASLLLDGEFDIERNFRDRRQTRVLAWAVRSFGPSLGDDAVSPQERALRFFEEAAEFYHAVIWLMHDTEASPEDYFEVHRARAEGIFTKRWNAEPGDVKQELGGVMVTLNALAEVLGLSIKVEEEREFNRVLAKPQSHWHARAEEKKGQGF